MGIMHILGTDHGHIKNTSTLFRDVLGKISFTRWISYDMHFIGSQMRFKYFDTCHIKNTSTLFRDVLGKISFTRWISYDMHFIGSQMRFKYFDTCQVL